MSSPVNPLDKYVSYTYHFELHASYSWDQLKHLLTDDANLATDRFSPNGTLLINTRKDAHQVIDDVKYMTVANNRANAGISVPLEVVEMIITEPGGFAFIEKIQILKDQQQVTSASNLTFVLKPIFVGRLPNNEWETSYGDIVSIGLTGFKAAFDHKGGVYNLKFTGVSQMAATNGVTNGQVLRYAFTDKNLAFTATETLDALRKLQARLNENYAETYTNKLERGGIRPIRYEITVDSGDTEARDGSLGSVAGFSFDSTIKTDFVEDSNVHFSFDPKREIGSIIMEILHKSKALNEKIGASQEGFKKQLHPNVWIPVIIPRVYMKDDEVLVNYYVTFYDGGGPKWEFDYYFSEPGKNVDVMQFEVVYDEMVAYMSTKSNQGFDKTANSSSTMQQNHPRVYQLDLIHPDTTRQKLYGLTPEKAPLVGTLIHDVAPLRSIGANERRGYNTHPNADVKQIRMAMQSSSEFASAGGRMQQTLVIRGNPDLLRQCSGTPDGEKNAFGSFSSIWIKVNVWMPIGDTGMLRQFYYTGYYQTTTITNHFSGGHFTQHISMLAKEP